MRKADVVGSIAEKTGIPKVDILVALETFFKEVKVSLVEGETGRYEIKSQRDRGPCDGPLWTEGPSTGGFEPIQFLLGK